MNKFTRFTLFAGLVAFGVAACGDDVQVVQPDPPPPPPLVVSLEPGAVAIDPGEMVELAVNVSGGASGETASWTCSTSASGVATVAGTAAGCAVTGVEAGSATVTAVVTKGNLTANAGASVTVLEDTSVPATVVIEKVTQGLLNAPVALNNVRRQVEVTVNIDPGTQVLTEVSLHFRGEEIASQTLTPAQSAAIRAAIAEGSPEEQVLRVIVFPFETDLYAIDAGGGEIDGTASAIVDHLNGQGNLVAQVTVDDGTAAGDAVQSASLQITLRNANGFHLNIDRTGSTKTALDVQGFEWRGGVDDAGTANAGIDAHLIPVVYTVNGAVPGTALGLESALFTFAGIPVAVASAAGAWTWVWTPAALAGYTMGSVAAPIPAGNSGLALPAAFPNQLRDGEFPTVLGNATLSDGQGMGPFGGALDCTGTPTGLLNVEVSAIGLCPAGTAWSPPSATRVSDANEILDVLRVGERVDNAGPLGRTFIMASIPGTPDFPQVPNPGGPVIEIGVWINGHVDAGGAPAGPFHPAGAPGGYQFASAIGGAGGNPCFAPAADPTGLWDTGVSRCVPGFPAPEFGDRLYEGSMDAGATYADMTANPTGSYFPESITNNVYAAQVTEFDELMGPTITSLSGNGANAGLVLFGQESGRPIESHNPLSVLDKFAYDGVAPFDDPVIAASNYDVNWTDPITTAASGFTAFGPSPIWRQIHLIVPGGPIVIVGGPGSSISAADYAAGGSLQPVCGPLPGGGIYPDGYCAWRSYALDDAGNLGIEGTDARTATTKGGDLPMVSQVAVSRQITSRATVFGITAPVNMVGGTAVTFTSNASHTFDLGLGFLALDYPAVNDSGVFPGSFWAPAPAAQTPGGYYTPAPGVIGAAAPPATQGTTGGMQFSGAAFELGTTYDSPLESVATLAPTATPFSHSVGQFVRSIEFVCLGPGVPHADCMAAPADFGTLSGLYAVPGAVGYFPTDTGLGTGPADLFYAAGRPSSAHFTVYDATRPEEMGSAYPGTSNFGLEQIGATSATSPLPNRGVSSATINPISVALNTSGGVAPESAFDDLATAAPTLGSPTHFAWGIFAMGAPAVSAIGAGPGRTLTIPTVTARLVSLSSSAVDGPGQNIFAGPMGRVDFFILEPATGALRYGGSQTNPVLNESNPGCGGAVPAVAVLYRCWDFTTTISVNNFVGAGAGAVTAQVIAVGVADESPVAGVLAGLGVTARGDGLTTYPVATAAF